jgi:hypothetical protein
MGGHICRGDALDLIQAFDEVPSLIATDPPYSFSGKGDEHALSATVAVVLRECAQRLRRNSWMLVFSAASWRSTAFMVEAVRGVLEPVRIATWCKPQRRRRDGLALGQRQRHCLSQRRRRRPQKRRARPYHRGAAQGRPPRRIAGRGGAMGSQALRVARRPVPRPVCRIRRARRRRGAIGSICSSSTNASLRCGTSRGFFGVPTRS